MAKRKHSVYSGERDKIFNSKEQEERYGYDKKQREDKKQIILLEEVSGKNINELLTEFGAANFSIRDIAILANISPKRLQEQIDKGEADFNHNRFTEERIMFQSYMLGLKSLEKQVVVENLRFKNPDKLLAVINPEKYSDAMVDKFDIPVINISFGPKKDNEDEEEQVDIKDVIEKE